MILILFLCCFPSFLFSSHVKVSQVYVAPLSIDVSQCYIPMQVQSPPCKISRKLALSPVHHKLKQQKQKELVESEKYTAEIIAEWQKEMQHKQEKNKKGCYCSQFIMLLCSKNT